MAHIMGKSIRAGLQPLVLDWLQHTNGGSMRTVALGSGAAVGTFSLTAGYLKAILMTTPNTPDFIIRDGVATIVTFASGAVGAQLFQPCWYEYSSPLTIVKSLGTAETWYLLCATSAKDPSNAL